MEIRPEILIQEVRKHSRLYERKLLNDEEFLQKFNDNLASSSAASSELADALLQELPQQIRPCLKEAIQFWLTPAYRKPAWLYGGARPVTDAEKVAESALLTKNVKAWAAVLAQCLENGDE